MRISNGAAKVAIIGGGAAGMSCALWLKYYGFEPLIIDSGKKLGGALLVSEHLNSWVLGQEHCNGIAMARRFEKHIKNEHIALQLTTDVKNIFVRENGFELGLYAVSSKHTIIHVAAIALCMGMKSVGGEALAGMRGFASIQKEGKITFGQPSPGQIEWLQGTEVVVMGGGDNAYEAALELSNNGCRVSLIMRSATSHAQRQLQDKVSQKESAGAIKIYHSVTIAHFEKGDNIIQLKLSNGELVSAVHVFALFGYSASTAWLKEQLPTINADQKGFIKTSQDMRSSLPHVYAAGDIISCDNKSVVTAIAQGSVAARSIQRDFL